MIWNGTDLGSIEVVDVTKTKIDFQLMSVDISKLPTEGMKPNNTGLALDTLGAGSSAFVLDTGDVYVFHGQSKTWNKL